jgi:hypothetical protein
MPVQQEPPNRVFRIVWHDGEQEVISAHGSSHDPHTGHWVAFRYIYGRRQMVIDVNPAAIKKIIDITDESAG